MRLQALDLLVQVVCRTIPQPLQPTAPNSVRTAGKGKTDQTLSPLTPA
jgi:hypothetical protein